MTGTCRAVLICVLFSLHVALTGCGKSSPEVKADATAFDSATPDIKDTWDKAVAADKTDDYVTAVTDYTQILGQQTNLSDAQIATVKQAYVALSQRLTAAATKGDSDARQALTTLGQMERKQSLQH